MAIRFAREPENGSALVRAGLDRLAAREGPLKLTKEAFNTLTVEAPPHAVFDLHADEIAAGGGLETAHATGFRYLVKAAGVPVADAEVHADASGKATLLANQNYGPYVVATARAFDELPDFERVRSGTYEARLLRFSAIYLVAIWLATGDEGADIIYPLAPAPDVLQAEHPYTVGEFLEAIRPLARKRAEQRYSAIVP